MPTEQGTPVAAARADDVPRLVEELRDLFVRLSEGKLSAAEIEPTANIFEFGYVDSLTGVMLLAEIEERYGVRIDDLEFVERLTTLEAIAEHVSARLR